MKMVVTGGGTGGHIYPALAVIREMQKRHPDTEVLYLGNRDSMEEKIISGEGISFDVVRSGGLRGGLKNVSAVFRVMTGLVDALRIMSGFRPDVVFGTGGYVCAPVFAAAHFLHIPFFIHEQNSLPGKTNLFFGRYAAGVFVSFPSSAEKFRNDRVIYTGLPVRKEFFSLSRKEARKRTGIGVEDKLVLVTGGSRGAASINNAFAETLPELLKDERIRAVFVTGKDNYEKVLGKLRSAGILPGKTPALEVMPYTDRMHEYLVAADAAVSRAGASFLWEAMAAGTPLVTVPFPYAAGNHQYYNACETVESGQAVLLEDGSLDGEKLFAALGRVLAEAGEIRERIAGHELPEAAGMICDRLWEECTGRKK